MSRGNHGQSALEFALFLPFLLFLFVGAFDWGFYAWALITTQNAARAAALYTSASPSKAADSAGACTVVAAEMSAAPNVGANPSCTAAPLAVTATGIPSGPDGAPASKVSVTYTTPFLIPIPALLTGQVAITRTVEMRVRS